MSILHPAPGSTAGKAFKVKKGHAIQKMHSSPHSNAIGSGSRPTKSMIPIHTTSPHDPHHLDSRRVPGALGQSAASATTGAKRPPVIPKKNKLKNK